MTIVALLRSVCHSYPHLVHCLVNDCSNTLFKVFSYCRRLDKSDHPLPVNLSRLIINAQKRFSIDRNQVRECWF